MNKTIRILMAVPIDLWNPQERETLETTFDVLWVHQTENGSTISDLVSLQATNILVADLRDIGINGIKHVHRIADRFPCLGIIAILDAKDITTVYRALWAGARGCVPANVTAHELAQAVNAVHYGGTHISAPLLRKLEALSDHSFSHPPLQLPPEFTANELQVLQCICQEKETAEIAFEMNVDSRTIEAYRERLYEKTGAKHIAGIIIFALRHGYYKPAEMKRSAEKRGTYYSKSDWHSNGAFKYPNP